jgi:ubiquinone/menaquinone biosynthesis C-methylase UbiE
MTDTVSIAKAYDAGVTDEYLRLESNPLGESEFRLITELMEQYIQQGSTVIDIGAGPGRYAEYLLRMGCKVGLADLSEKSLGAFYGRISDRYKHNILFSRVACATDLSFIDNESADAALLMGPMYHLTECEERTRAISECFRILKPGGLLFAVFMSIFSEKHKHHEHGEHTICCSDHVKQLLNERITTISFQGYSIPQYRCMPDMAKNSIETNGFGTIRIRNIEGTGSALTEHELNKINTPEEKQKLFVSLRLSCEDESLLGLTRQYLYVGRKNNINI